jgi:hypothetical protein
MDKKPLMMISICAVVLLVLGSLNNVVGYQSVQSSNQNVIKEKINQKELLFQTIADIANNKEIQGIILKSQMNRGIFPASDIPVLTKNQIRQMYFIGLILSKVVSTSRMQSMIGKYQFDNQEIQKEISAVIEKNTPLITEITLLSSQKCECEATTTEQKTSHITQTGYPTLFCGILKLIFFALFLILSPMVLIEELFHYTIYESLGKLIILITYPIWYPIMILFVISYYLGMRICGWYEWPTTSRAFPEDLAGDIL